MANSTDVHKVVHSHTLALRVLRIYSCWGHLFQRCLEVRQHQTAQLQHLLGGRQANACITICCCWAIISCRLQATLVYSCFLMSVIQSASLPCMRALLLPLLPEQLTHRCHDCQAADGCQVTATVAAGLLR